MSERRLEKIDYFLIISVVVVVLCGIFTLYFQEANISDGPGKWYKQLLCHRFIYHAFYESG